jgi:hypothetical protein
MGLAITCLVGSCEELFAGLGQSDIPTRAPEYTEVNILNNGICLSMVESRLAVVSVRNRPEVPTLPALQPRYGGVNRRGSQNGHERPPKWPRPDIREILELHDLVVEIDLPMHTGICRSS